MRCQYCNREIPDDSAFCPACGKKQDLSAPRARTCPACGALMGKEDSFCSECGRLYKPDSTDDFREDSAPDTSSNDGNDHSHHINSHFDDPGSTDIDSSSAFSEYMPYEPSKGKNSVKIALIVWAVILVLALAISLFFLFVRDDDPFELNESPLLVEQKNQSDTLSEDDADDINLSDVDFNLLKDDKLSLKGLIKDAKDGEKFLHWNDALTFYGEDSDGTKILLEDARNSYINESDLPDGMLDSIDSNQTVSIEGHLYFDEERLYITPSKILDENDKDMISAFEEKEAGETKEKNKAEESEKYTETKTVKEENEETTDNDFILPQSTSRLLGHSDVSGLSLREINYAKNEIYARHGRLFSSQELQNYFNSKSWYHGTVKPDSFSESLLSDIEKKNAEFLATTEFGINPNGYLLDAN